MFSVSIKNGKKYVKFFESKQIDNLIHIYDREELNELLDNYPSGSPRVIIDSNVDLKNLFKKRNGSYDISKWDVSEVKDLTDMFAFSSQKNFNISNWDVGNVKLMNGVFYFSKFRNDISNWDVSNVVSMKGMFQSSAFDRSDLSKWDVSNVVDMSYMFMETNFNKDISDWDVSNVKYTNYMFAKSKFDQDISNWELSSINPNMISFYMERKFSSCDMSEENKERIIEAWTYYFGDGEMDQQIETDLNNLFIDYKDLNSRKRGYRNKKLFRNI